MFALKDHKKLAGAVALFALCGLTAGCDDYDDHHRHPRPPHEDRQGDRHRERGGRERIRRCQARGPSGAEVVDGILFALSV